MEACLNRIFDAVMFSIVLNVSGFFLTIRRMKLGMSNSYRVTGSRHWYVAEYVGRSNTASTSPEKNIHATLLNSLFKLLLLWKAWAQRLQRGDGRSPILQTSEGGDLPILIHAINTCAGKLNWCCFDIPIKPFSEMTTHRSMWCACRTSVAKNPFFCLRLRRTRTGNL